MSNEQFYSRRPSRRLCAAERPGERLFEFRKGGDHYVGELRYHGEFGVEIKFLLNGDLYIARTFQDQQISTSPT